MDAPVASLAGQTLTRGEAARLPVAGGSVTSLKDATFYFVVEHAEAFSPASLALLPPRVRREILRLSPAAELWRLERCAAFVEELDMEAVWSERVETHILAWVSPAELSVARPETGVRSREFYLERVASLLLSTTSERLRQFLSPHHMVISLDPDETLKTVFDQCKRVCFRLSRVKPKCPRVGDPVSTAGSSAELVIRRDYINFLFYGVCAKTVPSLWKVETCAFDPEKEYHFPLRFVGGAATFLQRFREMVRCLADCTGWGPKQLNVVSPSREFMESVTDEAVLGFLHTVEEVRVDVTDVGFPEVIEALEAIFKPRASLSPTGLSIRVQFPHQLSWLLPRLTAVCGNRDAMNTESAQIRGETDGYLGLRKIDIEILERTSCDPSALMSCSDWSRLLHQENIESIVLTRLGTGVPPGLSSVLCHLLLGRPSLRAVQLTDCSVSSHHLQSLVSVFLSTPTTHSQTLSIRQWSPPSSQPHHSDNHTGGMTPETTTGVDVPCQSGENKVLCLPFIPAGPCSLPWLLALPRLSLPALELTIPDSLCETHLRDLLQILDSSDQLPVGSVTATVESSSPAEVESRCAGVMIDLAMCSHISEVRITAEV